VLLELQVLKVIQELLDLKALKEIQELPVHKVLKVILAPLVRLVLALQILNRQLLHKVMAVLM
jgi:hypothetical protein